MWEKIFIMGVVSIIIVCCVSIFIIFNIGVTRWASSPWSEGGDGEEVQSDVGLVFLIKVDEFVVPKAFWEGSLVSGKTVVVGLFPNGVHVSGRSDLFLPEGWSVWEKRVLVCKEGVNVTVAWVEVEGEEGGYTSSFGEVWTLGKFVTFFSSCFKTFFEFWRAGVYFYPHLDGCYCSLAFRCVFTKVGGGVWIVFPDPSHSWGELRVFWLTEDAGSGDVSNDWGGVPRLVSRLCPLKFVVVAAVAEL